MSCIRGVLLLALALSAAAVGQNIEYAKIYRAVLERRLHKVSIDVAERRSTLESIFRGAGCNGPSLTTQKVGGSREPNVICTLPGETDSLIIVGAHFDTIPKTQGAADNWSGTVLLPTLYQSLNTHPRRHTFVFVGFAAEEKGLYGSKKYVKELGKEGRARTVAMVNLDVLGLGPTKVWLSQSDKTLADYLAWVANSLQLPLAVVNAERVGLSDHDSFRRKKIPSIAIHSVTQETLPIINSKEDTLEVIQMDDYYDTYVLTAMYLAYLDYKLD